MGKYDSIFEHNASWYADLPIADEPEPQQIRVIRILPGKFRDPLVCDLEIIPIKQEIDYNALSYSWSGTSGQNVVQLNGQPGFKVTQNAFTALRRIRESEVFRAVPLWIDAICINQTNILERNSQVAFMGDIFANARRVIVWLGTCGNSPEASLGDRACPSQDGMAPSIYRYSMIQMCTLPNESVDIPEQAWWHRCWTLQEAVLARELVILLGRHEYNFETTLNEWYPGRKRFLFEQLLMFSRWNNSDPSYVEALEAFANEMSRLRELRSMISSPDLTQNVFGLKRLLLDTYTRHASDPRDKIFSVFGLFKKVALDSAITVDYTKPVKLVVLDTVAALIHAKTAFESESNQNRQRLARLDDILLTHVLGRHSWPSWLPDLTSCEPVREIQKLVTLPELSRRAYFEPRDEDGLTWQSLQGAGGESMQASVEGEVLSISGIAFDKILYAFHASLFREELLAQKHFQGSYCDLPTRLRGSIDAILAAQKPSKQGVSSDKARTLKENLTAQEIPLFREVSEAAEAAWLSLSPYGPYGYGSNRHGTTPSPTDLSKLNTAAQSCLISWENVLRRDLDFHLFITESGYVGLSRKEIRAADMVVALFGLFAPVVLRTSEAVNGEPAETYTLLSDAWVPSIMDGQLLWPRERDGMSPKLFKLV